MSPFVRVTHTGVYADGRPNGSSVLLTDVDYTGQLQQNRKAQVYVPANGSVEIPLATDVAFSLEQGDIARFVEAGVLTAQVFGTGGGSTANTVTQFDDWVSNSFQGALGWQALSNGSGSGASPSTTEIDPSHPGVIALSTGTSVGGRGAVRLGQARLTTPPPGGTMFIEWLIRIETLGDAVDDYFVNVGFSDNNSGGQGSNTIAFRYDFGGTTWVGFSRAGGGGDSASFDSGVAVDTNWTKLRIDIDDTGATFSIGPSPGDLAVVGTIPRANLPFGTAQITGPQALIQKQSGTSVRIMYVDYCNYGYTFDAAR